MSIKNLLNSIAFWIVCGLALAGLLYWYFIMKPKQDAAKLVADHAAKLAGQYALSDADEAAYKELLTFMTQQPRWNEIKWILNDIPLYFPGGARESWVQPDMPNNQKSKLTRLYTATNEIPTGTWDGLVGNAVYQKYRDLQRNVVQSLIGE